MTQEIQAKQKYEALEAERSELSPYEEGDIPLVSVIILTHNQLDATKDCVESIRRHTPESYEIIFVDNGSTNGSLSWLKDLTGAAPNYHLIENSENLGFSAGRNQEGIRAARLFVEACAICGSSLRPSGRRAAKP